MSTPVPLNDPFAALLKAVALKTPAFPPNSRYHGLPTATLVRPGRDPLPYITRRFIPPHETLAVMQEHAVAQGDRLDNLAARYLGDPELYWRLADANGALRPDDLLEPLGRRLLIALPGGATCA